MTQKTKNICLAVIAIVELGLSVVSWATAVRMGLLGSWLPSCIAMIAAAWMGSVAEQAVDRMRPKRMPWGGNDL